MGGLSWQKYAAHALPYAVNIPEQKLEGQVTRIGELINPMTLRELYLYD